MDPATLSLIASLGGSVLSAGGGFLGAKGAEKSNRADRAQRNRFHADELASADYNRRYQSRDDDIRRPGDFISMMQSLGNLRKSAPQSDPFVGMRLASGSY